jgi:hypothetical protein
MNIAENSKEHGMAKAKRYSMEQTLAAQKSLRALATKKTGKTKAEVVDFLAADIRKAVAQGHSLEEIQEVLSKAGIAAPISRMKAVLDGEARKGIEQEVKTAQTVAVAASGKEPVNTKTPPMEETAKVTTPASYAGAKSAEPPPPPLDFGLLEL